MPYMTTKYGSPLGMITLGSDGESLIGLWFDGQKYDRASFNGQSAVEGNLPVFEETKNWLDVYFSGESPGFTPPIKVAGSDFRKAVSDIIRSIPFGETITYGEIAEEVARRTGNDRVSAQAVGGAVGRNPVSIIIPCHRVVGANGSLTGYAGGIDKKVRLLELEGVCMKGLFVPAR